MSGDTTESRFGRYAIVEPLAKGGMAEVFIAKKDGADNICVLKRLLVELESHDTAGKRFYREAHVASFMNHPNIATISDAGFEGNRFYLAMDFIAGQDAEAMMHHLMRQQRMLPFEVSMSIALGVLDGLAYAHDMTDPAGAPLELVHRDLSPRNMMVSYAGDVQIIDFGLARGKVDTFRTAPGMLLGTLRYVSPEQALTKPVDRRSDIYTLAVVLWEMLTGRIMVPEGQTVDILKHVVHTAPGLVSQLNPHLPAALDPVVAKGLAKRPEERWDTAAEFAAALREAAPGLSKLTKEALGGFVKQMFPEAHAKAVSILGRAGVASPSIGNTVDAADNPEVSRLMSLTNTGELLGSAGATRTGYVVPTDLAGTGEATRTGYVEPQELTRAGDPSDISVIRPQDLTSAGDPTDTAMRERPMPMMAAAPTASMSAAPSFAPPADSKLLTKGVMATLGIAAAVLVVLAISVVNSNSRSTTIQPEAVEPSGEIAFKATPGQQAEPKMPALIAPPKPTPVKSKPAPAKRKPRRVAEAPPPEPTPAPRPKRRQDKITRSITALKASPSTERFDSVLSMLQDGAERLPESLQKDVFAQIDRAGWVRESRKWEMKIEILESAAAALKKARREAAADR